VPVIYRSAAAGGCGLKSKFTGAAGVPANEFPNGVTVNEYWVYADNVGKL
jgi:hypothetical protein